MGTERDRVISISLSEGEWQALVARHPQPVNWLRDRIRETLGTSDQNATSAAWLHTPDRAASDARLPR